MTSAEHAQLGYQIGNLESERGIKKFSLLYIIYFKHLETTLKVQFRSIPNHVIPIQPTSETLILQEP